MKLEIPSTSHRPGPQASAPEATWPWTLMTRDNPIQYVDSSFTHLLSLLTCWARWPCWSTLEHWCHWCPGPTPPDRWSSKCRQSNIFIGDINIMMLFKSYDVVLCPPCRQRRCRERQASTPPGSVLSTRPTLRRILCLRRFCFILLSASFMNKWLLFFLKFKINF